jgi:hypothetical protein
MATGKSKQSSHFNHDASDQKNESKSIPQNSNRSNTSLITYDLSKIENKE